jgi:alpha-L-rhamnosidase
MTSTLFTGYVNKLFSKMTGAVGNGDEAKKYSDISANVVKAFGEKFRNEDGTFKANTQTPYAMYLYFGFASNDTDRLFLAQTLAKNINDHNGTLTSGIVGIKYLTPSLSQNQQVEAAFTLLEQEEYPSWIYCINQGATTIWERWDSYTVTKGFQSPSMNSFNHYAFGSVGEWMISGVLGIRPDEDQPGYRHFLLDPQYGGTLTYAKGHYDSVVGRIESSWSWNRESGVFGYNCTVPANTRATVFIPADTPLHVTEGNEGGSAYDAEGVTYVGYNPNTKREVFDIASGTYIFGSNVLPASS